MHSKETPNEQRLATINRMLESLTFEEANMLRERFGLTDEKAKPLEELALELAKLSPAEIRDIERQAFLRLKQPS
jgi:DNA-directed RNA polymerase sigma subunit (sigma70/sigma32)